MVQGKSFTSNTTKLLKHLDKLEIIQSGGIPSPVMVHMSICNPCNLTCSFCCFANRAMTEVLEIDRIKLALKQFRELGATGIEFSIKGNELIPYRNKFGNLCLQTIEKIVDNRSDVNSFTIDDNKKFIEDKIIDWIKHPQQESLYKITLLGGRNITVTKSHSIFFYKDGKIDFKPISEAILGDYVVVSKQKPYIEEVNSIFFQDKVIDINKDFCRLLGYFIAEGSYTYQREHVPHGIVFTFDKYEEEHEYIDDVVNILTNMGYTPSIDKMENKTNIRVSRKCLNQLFSHLDTGNEATNKRVPDIILNVSEEKQIEFLKGYFSGDGTFRNTIYLKKGKSFHRNELVAKTSSEILQKSLSYLLDLLGIHHTLNCGTNKIRFIEGRRLEESTYYTISIGNRLGLDRLKSIVSILGGESKYKDSKYSNHQLKIKCININEDCYALPITKIEKLQDKEEYVYDISIGDTHRFESSYRILCHNTGGGEPTIHPKFDEAVKYAYDLGFAIGVCTNGTTLRKWHDKCNLWQYFTYVRLGMYGFTEGYTYDLSVFEGLKTKVSAAYVWDMNIDTSENPNITGEWNKTEKKRLAQNYQELDQFYQMLDWVEENKIPTRIAFNAIKDPSVVMKDIDVIRQQIKNYQELKGELKSAFLSDFNYKGTRRNDHCYMHMVKPFVYTDGSVYVCPSSELSHENLYDMNNEFKLCDIEGILDYYNSLEGGPDISRRYHACAFCKYAMQNELVDDIVTETENNEFA